LIDSTVFIRAERDRKTPIELVADLMATWGDQELGLSAMSVEELFHGCWRADTVARRAARLEFVETMLAAVPVIPVTLAVARVFGEIDARLSTVGSVFLHRICLSLPPRFPAVIKSSPATYGTSTASEVLSYAESCR
jgi:predicted nucleic acid-binding protein